MDTGTIAIFLEKKGCGFIQPDEGGITYFFHISAYCGARGPKVGEHVSYELAPPSKYGLRKQAVNVTPIESASVESAGDKAGA